MIDIKRRGIIISIVLMVTALIGVFSIGIFQSVMSLRDKPDAADGYTFTSDSAIKKDTYNANSIFYIGTADGFKGFVATSKEQDWDGVISYNWSGKTIKLTADINMSDWSTTPICSDISITNFYYAAFAGTFDGQNHTLSNLNISAPKDSGDPVFAGLFGELGNCTIQNIRFNDIIVTNDNEKSSEPLYMGTVAGTMSISATIANCIIENCEIKNNASVTNLYTSPTAGACIDTFDQAKVYSNMTGSYTWNTQMTLHIGSLQRIVVRNFYNNDPNGCKLGPDYVKFYLSWITYGTYYVSIEASLLNMYECVIGDNVGGGSYCCGVSKESAAGNSNSNYNQNLALGPIPAVGLNSQYIFGRIDSQVYDDANDYSRLTVANETMNPSGYTWYRSAIAYNDTPYLAAFVTANILVQSSNGSYGYLAYRDRWNTVRMDVQTSFYLYFPYEVYAPWWTNNVFYPFGSASERVEAYANTGEFCSFSRWDFAPLNGNNLTQHAVASFSKDTYKVSFKPAPNDNLYFDKNNTSTIKPYLFDVNGNQVSPGFASTDSDGTLKVTVPKINVPLWYNTDLESYDSNNAGYLRVYAFELYGTVYHVKYKFEHAVPELSITGHASSLEGMYITSDLDVTTTFNGGYVNLQFLTVNNTEISNPVGSIDELQYEYRIPINSEVSASVTDENQIITYSINNEQKITYTCQNECKIAGTGLGNSSNLMANSKTISTKGIIHEIYPIINWDSDNVIDPEPVPDPSGVTLTFNVAKYDLLDRSGIGYVIYAVDDTTENKLGYNTKHLGLTITDRGEAIFNLEGVESLKVDFIQDVNMENNPILNAYYYLVTVNDSIKYKVCYNLATPDQYLLAIKTHNYNGNMREISSFELSSESVQIVPIITLKSYEMVDGSKS